ncbi:ABC transporter ATP-binding protein [Maridesulfovibrio salexigens]|uniref:ABC transporter related n=1 Tax=Maridesulfovibrio salexigens (strain ATCC 14822 / DSM 2638 / NCIMB 8403 / VKM B-1763) TaxID=526222 RepID=C6BTJ4_MARSD|nr:ABC transporter ATP-binding protein [Maridesulfovibrio salexigens]ACS81675.1 ABC transporter related [Maridesulfovibrio salexigens DSM 2638]
MIKKIKGLLNPAQKKSIFALVVLSILISGIETVGISAILPFISVASDFSLVTGNKYYNFAYTFFGFSDAQSFVITFGLVLIGFYVSRGFLNLCYMYFIQRYSQGIFLSLGTKLFSNYVHIKYQDMTTRNSSDLSKKLITETNNAALFFYSLLLLISELFVSSFLYTALLVVNWKVTLALTGFLGLMVLLLIKIVSRLIKKEGLKRNQFQEVYYRTISETLSNLKFIKLMAGEKTAINALHKSGKGYVDAMVMNNTYNTVPRLSLESIGFSMLIAALILALQSGQAISSIIPVVSLFGLAMYRMLPSVNRILSSYNNMLYYNKSIDLLYEDFHLETHRLGNDPIKFKDQINIRNMSFGYTEELILKNISLNITKGEKIALIGESGAGKSTLADIIIGMYTSFSGNIDVDETPLTEKNMLSWREKIGYIPQSIYLFDSTVSENVAFGRKFDEQKLKEALNKAELTPFLEQNQGIHTPVGEDGSQLSGGQKQRIGIARAIYGNPDLLVLDEATSALDSQTEQRIMDNIFKVSEGKTLIIIAHRLSTIEQCDKVYRIEDKGIRLIEDKNTLKG